MASGPRRLGTLGIAGLSLLGFLGATPATADAAVARFSHTGNAFGTSASVGNVVKSGPTALVALGCGTEAGVHKSNTVATVDAGSLALSGTVTTTATTSADPTQTRTTAETEKVRLLDGMIRADVVRAVSTTTFGDGGFTVSGKGSTFVNLRVGGLSLSATPEPNEEVDLPGLGKVVLNEQEARITKKRAMLTVNMIHVYITEANLLGYEVGTEIIVSHAKSGLEGPVDRFLDGRAYGTSVKVNASAGELDDGLGVRSGPSALVVMPCLGTNGRLKTNEILTVNVPGVLTSGTVRSTAQGKITATTATAETSSTVEGVNLLGGLVTASVIRANARASADGTTSTFDDGDSGLLNLSVSGNPEITAEAKVNTKVKLSGLGTLWIHRVIQDENSIEVRMIELVVEDSSNSFGLLLGTRIRVGVASASLH